MALLEWRDSFSVGVAALDADHRKLADLINELHQARAEQSSAVPVRSVIERLDAHVREHFAREERLMEKIGFAGLVDHRRHHDQTFRRIRSFLADVRNG